MIVPPFPWPPPSSTHSKHLKNYWGIADAAADLTLKKIYKGKIVLKFNVNSSLSL